jgi:hypothetical protein
MSDLMQHLNFVKPYLDNLLVILCNTFEEPLEKLECVLKILPDKVLRVNADKSTLCDDEIKYLGYWVSRSGIQHIPKKVETIKNMVCPATCEEFRRFIGMVGYYHDMRVRMRELLAPLANMTSKNVKFNWPDEH